MRQRNDNHICPDPNVLRQKLNWAKDSSFSTLSNTNILPADVTPTNKVYSTNMFWVLLIPHTKGQ